MCISMSFIKSYFHYRKKVNVTVKFSYILRVQLQNEVHVIPSHINALDMNIKKTRKTLSCSQMYTLNIKLI